MKKYALYIFLVLTIAPCINAQSFFQKAGGAWEGTLEYLDYSKNTRVKLETTLTIEPAADGRSAKFTYIYDDVGRVIKSEDLHRIEPGGRYFIGEDEFSIEETADGQVLYGRGQDGDSVEPVRKTVTLTDDTLTILKETRSPYTFRHRYTFRRSMENIAPERILTPGQMVEDLAILKKALIEVHPGVYRYNTPAELEVAFADHAERIKEPQPEGRFFAMVAQITASLKCGHTFQNPLNQPKMLRSGILARRNYLPFYFRLVEKKMIVTRDLSNIKLPAGSEILTINGVPVAQVIDTLMTAVPADGRGTLAHRLKTLELESVEENRYQFFDIFYPLFFPVKDGIFNIEAVNYASKKQIKFQVPALTRQGRFARTGKVPTYDDGWRFEMKGNSTAVLRIGNSITWRLKTVEWKKFLAEAFGAVKRENVRELVIDLRGNGGGDMEIGFELASYLARRNLPLYITSRRLVRNVSPRPNLAAFMDTYSDDLKAALKDGLPQTAYRRSGDYFEVLPSPGLESFPAVTPYPDSFRGTVFIISDSSNASATFQFLEFVKNHRLATIVGHETGGNRQGINGGNYFFLTLPNSRVETDIPVYFQAPRGRREDRGIVPDVITPPSIDDIAAGRDTELNFIFSRVKK